MKRLIFAVMLAAAAMVQPAPAHSLPWTDVMLWSEEARYAYLSGVLDGSSAILQFRKEKQDICIPKNVSREKIMKVAEEAIEAHPEEWDHNAASWALVAWLQTWPC